MKAEGIPLSGPKAKSHLRTLFQPSQKEETKRAAKALLEGLEMNRELLRSSKFSKTTKKEAAARNTTKYYC